MSIGDLPFGVCSTFSPNRPARNAAGGDRPLDEDQKKEMGCGLAVQSSGRAPPSEEFDNLESSSDLFAFALD
jgi:hypothetical protein